MLHDGYGAFGKPCFSRMEKRSGCLQSLAVWNRIDKQGHVCRERHSATAAGKRARAVLLQLGRAFTRAFQHERESAIDIDFLAVQGFSDAAGKLRLCPIEAKSSKTYSTISLDDFKKRWPKRVGAEVVLHPKQLKAEGHRAYLPLYMSFCV